MRASREVELDQQRERREIMASMKTMMVILMTIIFSLLFISQLSHAEIYKWVDEKGTVHFTEDPATIPERYRDQAQTKAFEESPPAILPNKDSMKAKENQVPERGTPGLVARHLTQEIPDRTRLGFAHPCSPFRPWGAEALNSVPWAWLETSRNLATVGQSRFDNTHAPA